jgi:predicted nicotinamide N-methyase
MEMYIAADMPDRDPYWCEPWPSAVAMSAELLQRPQLVAGKRVCELGCGLGLAGLAAAMAGGCALKALCRTFCEHLLSAVTAARFPDHIVCRR